MLELADLQRLLRPGEAYYKMLVVGGDAYAVFATAGSRARLPDRRQRRPSSSARSTRCARPSRCVEDNQQLTYPFDLDLAHALYQALFGPVAGELAPASPI